VSDRQKD